MSQALSQVSTNSSSKFVAVIFHNGEGEATDEELVTAACGGEESAFRLLLERHHRSVKRIAGRFFRQREVIEEIMQVSFTEAWLSLGSYQGRGEGSFAAWLSRITINTCYDELRRLWRRKENYFSELSEEEAEFLSERLPDHRVNLNIEKALISRDLTSKLLSRLDPQDQLVLVLLKIEGLTVAEIAKLTGWSPAKVKMRVHRARGIFKRVRVRLL